MAIQQLTLPGEIVKKHNELIRSKINVNSQTAGKILACLVACIRTDDTQFKDYYSVNIKDYLNDTGGNQRKQIRDACRELVTATVESEWPDPDNPDDFIFHAIPFFSSIKYRKGIVEAKFNLEMQGFLLELKGVFSQYNLIEYLKLPSSYSQRIFELLMSWKFKPEVTLSVADLHKWLETPPSFRADFKAFRIRVLEKAQKDIQKHTALRFDWQPVKAGHSVEAIRFLFSSQRKAITEAETKKAKIEKQKRLNNDRYKRASNCALGKSGNCLQQDNKPIICKVCLEYRFCEDLRKNGGKPFDPAAGRH